MVLSRRLGWTNNRIVSALLGWGQWCHHQGRCNLEQNSPNLLFYLILLRLARFCWALLILPPYLLILVHSVLTIGHTNKTVINRVIVARIAALITMGSV